MCCTLKQKLANHENPIISVAAVKCESKKKQVGDKELQKMIQEKITAIEDKLESQADQDLSVISSDIKELKDSMSKALKDIEINNKVNELQDSKIEQVRIKATNPLAN